MAFVDGTLVNVALPSLQSQRHAPYHQVQWVVEAYALALAALLLPGGALGDRFGRRRIFVLGVLIFGAASVLCGASQSIETLVAARALQGLGAAMLMPGSFALISTSFAESERGRAIGIWAGFSALSAAVGPVIGGWLIDRYSWPWAFYLNAPIALLTAAMAAATVPESRGQCPTGSLDWMGAVLATVGLAGVTFGLVEGPAEGGTSEAVIRALAIGGVALYGFLLAERKVVRTMMPLDLFRDPVFAGANALILLVYAALAAGLLFVPLVLIRVHELSVAAAGAAFVPFILIMFAMPPWAGTLVDRVGPRKPLIAGALISACGYGGLALGSEGGNYWTAFLPGIAVLGFGMTLSVAPLTTAVMNAAGTYVDGIASGINNTVSRTAGVLAVAALGALATWSFSDHLELNLRMAKVPEELTRCVLAQRDHLGNIEVASINGAGALFAVRAAINDALISSFRLVMLVNAALCLLGSVCAWMLVRPMKDIHQDQLGRAERDATENGS